MVKYLLAVSTLMFGFSFAAFACPPGEQGKEKGSEGREEQSK